MRILYDYQIFSGQVYGGVSRYFVELARHLSAEQGVETKILAPLFINHYLRDLEAAIVTGKHVPLLSKYRRRLGVFNRLASRYWLKDFKPDIVHETYFTNLPLVTDEGVKRFVTVYDMVHEKFLHKYPPGDRTRALKASAVKRADHVICISENTRRDLIEILEVPEEKTSVIYLGYSLAGKALTAEPVAIDEPYILFVGRRGGYKNFENLLRAYAKSTLLKDQYFIVCFGGGEFSEREQALVKTLGISPSRIIHKAGSDDILASLYASAAAFVYPSLYEGFGLPPLEAMSFGCPVVCSNSGPMPEVAGNAAEMFDPSDEDHMAATIERVISSPAHAAKLVEKGLMRVQKFSWEKCARDTLGVYRKIVGD